MPTLTKRLDDLTAAIVPGVKPVIFIDLDADGNYTRDGAQLTPAEYAALCETHNVVEVVNRYDNLEDDSETA